MSERYPDVAWSAASLRVRAAGDGRDVLDPVRQQWVRLTPEEWVRQHLLVYLIEDRGYPRGLLAVEREVRYQGAAHRADVLAVGPGHKPLLLAECKAASVAIDQTAFDQAARYNSVARARLVVVTNGLALYCCEVNHTTQRYTFLNAIPTYAEAVRPGPLS